MVKAAWKSSLTWVPASAARARAANKGTIEALRHLIRKGDRKAVAKAVGQWTPENVVALLVHLPMKAARAAAGTAFKSLPVVDQDGRLIGEITQKMLERVVAEEAAEDMMKLGGVAEDARATDSVPRIVRNRLPWLLAGLIGATCAALIIGSFEDELAKAAILAAFIPVVMSMAGNSGLQASVVSVQALAMGDSWPGDRLIYRFARELMGALLNGAVAGSILAALILLGSTVFEIDNPARLAMATSLSLLSVTTIAAIVGAFVPLVLHRVGIDPAAATGVFITTSNDVLGVLVYFLMASAFYF